MSISAKSKSKLNWGIKDTTFEELQSLVSSNSLIPGMRYKFPFETIYFLFETASINTGATENIIITASSSSTFEEEVESVEYPNDVIRFNFFDQKAEDETTPRKGRITYRLDTIKNNSCFYDFRNVRFIRWSVDYSLFTPWATAMSYDTGDIVVIDGQLARCRSQHTSDAFYSDLGSFYWELILSMQYQKIWFSTIPFLGGRFYGNSPQAYYTFGDTVKNSHIGKPQILNYNNIVIMAGSDLSIGNDCYNGTIAHTYTGYDAPLNIVIKDNVTSFFIDSCNNNTIESNSSQFFIGFGCNENVIKKSTYALYINYECKSNTIEERTSRCYITDWSHFNVIGKDSSYCYLGGSSSYNLLGQEGQNMVFHSAWRNSIGRNNTDCRFKFALSNTTGESCSTIRNSVGVTDYGTMSYNTFGNSCSDIEVQGSLMYTLFKGRNESMTVNAEHNVSTCEFAVGVSYKTFDAYWYGIVFNVVTFTTKTYTQNLFGRTVSFTDNTTGDEWYIVIMGDTGAINTQKVI